MPDREKVIRGLENCANGTPCIGEKYVSCPFSPRNNNEPNCGVTMARAVIALLKEQEIVRCKDCQHGEKVNSVYLCGKSRGFGLAHEPVWFCADGEQQEEFDVFEGMTNENRTN